MNTRILSTWFICALQSLVVLADYCEFLRPPKAIKRVSNNPATPFKIRFTLKKDKEFCLMRVRIPSDTFVTFNLTRTRGAKKPNYLGDKMGGQMYITDNMKTLVVVNAGEEFGSRFGRYQLNQQEVYGVPYYESVYRKLGGSCGNRKEDSFDIDGEVETTKAFRRCLEYNEDKEGKKEDYLFCPNCKTSPSVSEDNTVLSFHMENVSEEEYYVVCKIKTDDDRVNYILRFLPTCSEKL